MNGLDSGVGAITLFVDDLARSRAFYGDALGLTPLFEDDVSTVYGFGHAVINIVAASSADEVITPLSRGKPTGVPFVLSIFVADVDAVCADLRERGVTLIAGPVDQTWGKRTALFTDPDGNAWEVAQDIPVAAG